eukprot:g6174.t1
MPVPDRWSVSSYLKHVAHVAQQFDQPSDACQNDTWQADDPNDLPRCIAPCLAETLANGYGERADVLGYLPGFWASPETPPTTTTTGMPCDTVGAQSCLQTVVAITDIQEFCARLPTAVECLKCSKSFEVPTPPMELHCAYVESDSSDIIYRDPLMVTSTGVPRMVERLADGSLRPAVPQGEVRCVKQRCAGSAPWPFGTSGSLSSCTDGLHGQFCEVLCAAGYTRDSNLASYQCEAGQWMVPTTPPCIESSCFAAPVLENAQRLQACANRPAGYECNVTCLSGYQPVGSLRCVQGAYELSGLGCVASAVATRTAQVAAAQVVLVSVSEAEANTTRGRVERSARGLLGLDSTVTPAQLAALVAEEVPSISPLDRALALAALQQLSPEAALRAALRTLLTAAIIPEVEALEVALTRLDAHGVWANASEVLVQSSPLALAVFVEGERETETDGASLAAAVLGGAELERIQAAFRAKALEARDGWQGGWK